MAKNKDFPYLKKFTKHRFQQVFKRILWDKNLSYGTKVFAMSLLTVPPQSKVNLKKLAKKLNTDPSQLSRWGNKLSSENLIVRSLEKLVGLSVEEAKEKQRLDKLKADVGKISRLKNRIETAQKDLIKLKKLTNVPL